MISTPAAADLNPGVLLLRNTNATREFFKNVRKLSENHKAVKKVIPSTRQIRRHRPSSD